MNIERIIIIIIIINIDYDDNDDWYLLMNVVYVLSAILLR